VECVKTHDLISILAQDAPVQRPFGPLVRKALAAGILLSLVLMISLIGLRENLSSAVETARVASKIFTSTVFAACACGLAVRIGQPGVPLRARANLLLLPLLLLAVSIAAELFTVPQDRWASSLVGDHAAFCLLAIPLLAIPPLAALLFALRQGAPERPAVAGGVAGLTAAAIASAIYALHCPDDSPLFVAAWYGLASLLVTLVGAMAGHRLLRW
jgi:hypothetical protein